MNRDRAGLCGDANVESRAIPWVDPIEALRSERHAGAGRVAAEITQDEKKSKPKDISTSLIRGDKAEF